MLIKATLLNKPVHKMNAQGQVGLHFLTTLEKLTMSLKVLLMSL